MPTMSRVERAFCRSTPWRAFTRAVVLPWALQGVRLDGRILEIGGGSGAMSAAIDESHPGAELTVTDYDPSMVDAARQRLDPYTWSRSSRPTPPICPSMTARSTRLCRSSWRTTSAPGSRLAEAVQVLRPGGTLAGYDLLSNRAMEAFHRAERAEHRMMRLAELWQLSPRSRYRTSRCSLGSQASWPGSAPGGGTASSETKPLTGRLIRTRLSGSSPRIPRRRTADRWRGKLRRLASSTPSHGVEATTRSLLPAPLLAGAVRLVVKRLSRSSR